MERSRPLDHDGVLEQDVLSHQVAELPDACAEQHGHQLSADIPELAVPDSLIERLEDDPDAWVDFACQMVVDIAEAGAFDGVHLIPVSRYRQVAARLDPRR